MSKTFEFYQKQSGAEKFYAGVLAFSDDVPLGCSGTAPYIALHFDHDGPLDKLLLFVPSRRRRRGGAEAEGPQENGGSGKRKRRKLSLLANIMHDLGLNDSQKLGVLLVFAGIIILPRFFGFDTRPTSKYGDAMRRQKKYAKEKGKKNASKPKRRNEQKKKS